MTQLISEQNRIQDAGVLPLVQEASKTAKEAQVDKLAKEALNMLSTENTPVAYKKAAGAGNGDILSELRPRVLNTLLNQINTVDGQIQNYLAEMEHRNSCTGRLNELKQRLNLAGDSVEWQKDAGLAALVEDARKLGVQIPSESTWNSKQIEALKSNINSVVDSHMHINETSNFRLTMQTNLLKILYQMLSDLEKVFHDIQEHQLRNLPTR